MDILLIGGGGREHAIAKKIKESKRLGHFYSIPGNPGITEISEVLSDKQDIKSMVNAAVEKKVDLIVCGPEQPLVEGLTDLANSCIRTFKTRSNA